MGQERYKPVTTGSIDDNTWTHLALTYSSESEEQILYIDGEEVGKLDNGGELQNSWIYRIEIGLFKKQFAKSFFL